MQKKQGGRLLKLLTDNQFVTEQDMVISMGRCLDKPPVNLAKVHVPETVMNLVPKDMAKSYKLVPIAVLGNKLFVAMADPMNVLALDDLRTRTKMDIVPMIATERSVNEALSGVHSATGAIDEVMKKAAAEAADAEAAGRPWKSRASSARTSTSTGSPPTARTARSSSIVNLILVQALKDRASDIHIEPAEKSVRLRYRLDGNLVEASGPPKSLQLAIASRIKILAGLNIAERRIPQDGRFRIRVSGKEVDLRISFLPTVYGEKIVIRILDKGALSGSIEQLGMDEHDARRFQESHRRAARHDPRHRSHRLRQDDDALLRAERTQQTRVQHRHGRRPGGIPAPWHQPGGREGRRRAGFRQRASLYPATGPGYRDDR